MAKRSVNSPPVSKTQISRHSCAQREDGNLHVNKPSPLLTFPAGEQTQIVLVRGDINTAIG